MIWFSIVAIVFAMYITVVFWPQKKEHPYYASLEQQEQMEWCHAFVRRVQETRQDISFDQAWSAACASYTTMANEDPRQSADVEMSYWD